MQPAIEALVFGLCSAASLPLGAILGVYFSPVNTYFVACTIAFGAGCLMFAVTIELYGVQLERIEHHHAEGENKGLNEFGITVFFAVLGGLGYIYLNRWMEGDAAEETHHDSARDDEEAEPVLSPQDRSTRAQLNWKVGHALANRERQEFYRAHRKDMCDEAFEHIANRKTGEKADPSSLAIAMFVGVLADGVPESILIGFLASKGKLSLGFVISIFIASFPESFSSGSILAQKKDFTAAKIIMLWTVPFVMTGVLSYLACWAVPASSAESDGIRYFSACVEGLASGMMLAMIGSVMLPEAYTMAHDEKGHGDFPGFICVVGFLFSVSLKVLGGAIHLAVHGHEAALDIDHTAALLTLG